MMELYKKLNGKSGIKAYEIKPRSIELEFNSGERYVYDYSDPGMSEVEIMKQLARRGKGLSTYVSQHIRDHYSFKRKKNAPS